MKTFDDPFDYPTEDEARELIRLHKRQQQEEKLGAPLPTWGGARKGAGRKPGPNKLYYFKFRLDRIQVKLLEEMGKGDIKQGIMSLIERNI